MHQVEEYKFSLYELRVIMPALSVYGNYLREFNESQLPFEARADLTDAIQRVSDVFQRVAKAVEASKNNRI